MKLHTLPNRNAAKSASRSRHFFAEDSLGKTLAVPFKRGANAPHIANVGAYAKNHQAAERGTSGGTGALGETGLKASSMQRR